MIEIREGYSPEIAEAIYQGYDDCPSEKNRTLEEFKALCMGAEMFFGFYDPEPVGGLIVSGPEAHAAILRRARGQCGHAFAECVKRVLERIPYLMAYIHQDNRAVIRLVTRLGFRPTTEHGNYMYYVRGYVR